MSSTKEVLDEEQLKLLDEFWEREYEEEMVHKLALQRASRK